MQDKRWEKRGNLYFNANFMPGTVLGNYTYIILYYLQGIFSLIPEVCF